EVCSSDLVLYLLIAKSSTLQQHNFAPVAKSDISVCIIALPLSFCHTHPVTYVFIHYRSKPIILEQITEGWCICYGFLLNTTHCHNGTGFMPTNRLCYRHPPVSALYPHSTTTCNEHGQQ